MSPGSPIRPRAPRHRGPDGKTLLCRAAWALFQEIEQRWRRARTLERGLIFRTRSPRSAPNTRLRPPTARMC